MDGWIQKTWIITKAYYTIVVYGMLYIPGDEDYKPIFGVALTLAVDRNKCHDGIQLPVVFRECIDYIEEFGKKTVRNL